MCISFDSSRKPTMKKRQPSTFMEICSRENKNATTTSSSMCAAPRRTYIGSHIFSMDYISKAVWFSVQKALRKYLGWVERHRGDFLVDVFLCVWACVLRIMFSHHSHPPLPLLSSRCASLVKFLSFHYIAGSRVRAHSTQFYTTSS